MDVFDGSDNRLLSPKEVANILGVEVATLSIWRSTNRYPLKFIKVGRLFRYCLRDVKQFLDARTWGHE